MPSNRAQSAWLSQKEIPMRALVPSLLVAALVVLGASAVSATPTYEPGNQMLYMRNDATACSGNPFLDVVPGANEVGCGYQGGAPFGELYHAGAPVASTIKNYATSDAVAFTLDATRNITGNNRVVATSQTNRMAVGQIRVDTKIFGSTATGGEITLGTATLTKTVDPTNSAEVDFPFTIDVPDSFDKSKLVSLRATVDIRGFHVLTGYHRLNGISKFDLPILIEKQ